MNDVMYSSKKWLHGHIIVARISAVYFE